MEREVGGGIGMGNTCKPIAVSFQCMTKFTTNKKKKRLTSGGIKVVHQQSTEQGDYPTLSQLEGRVRVLKLEEGGR